MFVHVTKIPVIVALVGCVPPPDASEITDLAINVEASHLTGPFTLTGNAFPDGPAEYGEIALHGANAQDLVVLGPTFAQDYDLFVVDGSYDLAYHLGAGGAIVPANASAELVGGQAIAGDALLPVDVGAVTISATFTLNGSPFPASEYDKGKFYLEPVGTDERIFLGNSHSPGGPVKVVPGTYHVSYDHQQGAISPINRGARVQQNVVLAADQQLRVDVVASPLRLTLTLNGNPFPLSEYNDATFHLRDELTKVESLVRNSHDPMTTVTVIDGTYDVIYRLQTGSTVPLDKSTMVPFNKAAVVVDDYVLSNGGAISHDITTVVIDASVRLNGSPFPVSEYEDGNILLHDPRTNTDTELGNTHDPFDDLVLIPGTYDLLYSHETGHGVPQNQRGTIAEGVAITNTNLNINVVGLEIGADITLNGESFPASDYQHARFVLVGAQSAADIVLGTSHDPSPSVMVMPGTYDLYYRHEIGDQVPANGNHRILASQALATSTTLSTDLETRFVRVAATLDHEPFPEELWNTAAIYARTGEGDDVLMLRTHDLPYTPMLISGDYELYYQHTTGFSVPRNPWAKVGEAAVQ